MSQQGFWKKKPYSALVQNLVWVNRSHKEILENTPDLGEWHELLSQTWKLWWQSHVTEKKYCINDHEGKEHIQEHVNVDTQVLNVSVARAKAIKLEYCHPKASNILYKIIWQFQPRCLYFNGIYWPWELGLFW